MDLAHIPLRGFPVPNPLVPRNKTAEALFLGVAALLVFVVIAVVASLSILLFISVRKLGREPRWDTVLGGAAWALILGTPALIPLLWGTRELASRVGGDVVPARVLSNDALLNYEPTNMARGLVASINNTGLMGQDYKLEHPFIEFEYVRDYQMRHCKTRIDRMYVWNVQPGEVLWIRLPRFMRHASGWSPAHGHKGSNCRVGAEVAAWFERAATAASRRRHERRRNKLAGMRAARRSRARYTRKA